MLFNRPAVRLPSFPDIQEIAVFCDGPAGCGIF